MTDADRRALAADVSAASRLTVEGRDLAGLKVAMIEDVISTVGAVVDAARLLREAGAQIVAVVCAIWRGAGEPAIPGLDAPVLPALRMSELP